MAPPGDELQRLRRSMWATVAYLLGFAVLITFVARYYLIPALRAANDATSGQRQQLSAYAMLMMAIVLLVVIVGIILTFRVSRFFFPSSTRDRTPTRYIDAWAESARRFEPSDDEESREEA